MCKRLGYTDGEALVLVMRVCDQAETAILLGGEYDTTWVNEVREEAACQIRVLRQRHS